MKQILVPTDFSANSLNAVHYALALFKNMPCTFYLLHVDEVEEEVVGHKTASAVIGTDEINSIKRKLNEFLQQVKVKTRNKDHIFLTIQDEGFFVDTVRRHVTNKKIDFILMGSKGSNDMKRLIMGSHTGEVITKVRCNTLMVPENVVLKQPKEVVFPTDFNIFYSLSILQSISELLTISFADLRIMNVIGNGDELSQIQKNNRSYLQDYMEEMFPRSYSFHTASETKIATAIHSFVDRTAVDMIVMVAKNLNFIQQMLFDSTMEKVSFHTKVPFLVLHE